MIEELILTTVAFRGLGIFTWWMTLIGSGGALLFPDLVLMEGLFADSFIDRGTVRLIAAPVFIVSAALVSDHYNPWIEGLF